MAKRKPAPPTGSGLRETRKSLGLTQTQLAADWGISPRMVRKLEAAPTLSPLYWGAALNLRLGLVTTPQRRTTAAGEPVSVRAPGGKTVKAKPAQAGRVVARLGKPNAGATVRRVTHWVPFDNPNVDSKVGADHVRETVLGRILADTAAAQAKGENVAVTVTISNANRGAALAGYDVVISSGKNVKKPRGQAYYFRPGDDVLMGLDDLDELASAAGLDY